jgi:phosphatidylserine/phosphatidylglycerophosphate/cardiolipin synthase-like enzyme
MPATAPSKTARRSFDGRKLERLASLYRQEAGEQTPALAKTAPTPKPPQPKLTIKSFKVNQARVAVSPDCSYRLLTEALQGAQHSLTVYVYNISAAYLVAILKAKKAAGLKVRVMVDSTDPNDAQSGELAKLIKAGLDVRVAPSSGARRAFTVCHQKYAVIDGKTLVLQSANWAGTAFPVITQVGQYKPGNREWLIRVDDTAVAAWFEDLFQKDWDIPAVPLLQVMAEVVPPQLAPTLMSVDAFIPLSTLFDIQSATKPFRLLPLISPVNYLAELSKALKTAKRRIWLQQQYIMAGDGVNELLEAVHSKSSTCDVRIIASPKYSSAWTKTEQTLRAAGLIGTLRAQNLAHVIHCHNKGVVIDDNLVVVSSTNWSENSITRAREAGLLIKSKELTGYFAGVFELDWNEAIKISQLASRTVVVSAAEMV